jgi:hypothetical protein
MLAGSFSVELAYSLLDGPADLLSLVYNVGVCV